MLAGGDDLAANILGDGGGAVEGEQDGCLELCLGALRLGLGHLERQARPLAQSEVDQVIDPGDGVGDHVDAPQARV